MNDAKIGYKVFNSDWTCRDFQYEVGKTYEIEGKLEIRRNGFHFCKKLVDCFNYYTFSTNLKVAVVQYDDTVTEDDKSATNKITIVSEMSWVDVLNMCNEGENNTGIRNTGDWNTGDWNTGDRNTGYRNTGDRNTGYRNTGDRNTGYRNTGDRNTGYRNTGDWNTGDWNKCNRETGFLNTTESTHINVFNKPCLRTEFESYDMPSFMLFNITRWDSDLDKTVAIDYKEAFKASWDNTDKKDRMRIKDCPNFDEEIFFEISGIRVSDYE